MISHVFFLSARRKRPFEGTEQKQYKFSASVSSKDSFKWKSDKQLPVHEKFKLFIGQKVSNEMRTARALTWLVNKINLPHERKPSEALCPFCMKKAFNEKLKRLFKTLLKHFKRFRLVL